jgi:tetratricopeptide (TPR) repeat protein
MGYSGLFSALSAMNRALLGINEEYRSTGNCDLSNEELLLIKEKVIVILQRDRINLDIRMVSELILGRVELLIGDRNAAVKHFARAFRMNHYNVEGFAEAGKILADMRKWKKIEILAGQGLRVLNTPRVMLTERGLTYDPRFFEKGAIRQRNKAEANILFVKGWLYEEKQQYGKAMHNYEESVFINPVEPSGYERMAACLERLGYYEDASLWYRSSAEIYFFLHADHKAARSKEKEIACGKKTDLPVYVPEGELAKLYLLSESRLVEDSEPLKNVSIAIKWIESSNNSIQNFWRGYDPNFKPQLVRKYIRDHVEFYCLAMEVYKAAGDHAKEKRMTEKLYGTARYFRLNSKVIEDYKRLAKTLRRR